MSDGVPAHVAMLESYLHDAKTKYHHSLIGVAMVAWATPTQPVASVNWAGAADLDEQGVKAAEKLLAAIQNQVASWKTPPPDPGLDGGYVVWNMAHGPSGFDFITWLINAEMMRRRQGASGPLKVGFYLGSDPNKALRDKNNARWLEKVYRPALEMLGAVEDDRAIYGNLLAPFLPAPIVQACGYGEEVPLFRSKLPSPHPGCIVITLREAHYWPHRNSRIADWLEFAAHLRTDGYEVIFVRDTDKAFEAIPDFETCPQASIDLATRVALYQEAICTFSDGGGPWQMCLFGHSPWLSFITMGQDSSEYRPNTPEYWRLYMGVEPGGQFPWSRPDQRLVWAPGTFKNIMAAWKDFPRERS
jgi:hypothetical protein